MGLTNKMLVINQFCNLEAVIPPILLHNLSHFIHAMTHCIKAEIDEWVINAIKSIGLDTAKAVLNAPREMLIEKADLEEDTVDDVLKVLSAEFEE